MAMSTTIRSDWLLASWLAVMAGLFISLAIQDSDGQWIPAAVTIILAILLLASASVFYWRKRHYFGPVALPVFLSIVAATSLMMGLIYAVLDRHTLVHGVLQAMMIVWPLSAILLGWRRSLP